jgi:hypothetical protein
LKQYKGAVFFVDLLGIGALTQKKIKLTEIDYVAFGLKIDQQSEQFFCAQLLIKFRSVLAKIKKENTKVNIAQLSDCAFVWSEDVASVVDAARKIMYLAIRSGILLRGGLAYGDIVEPNKINHRIGHFILGEASTKAVKLESAGKGCRIFSDSELPSELTNSFSQYLFSPLKSPLDGAIVDEFKWYLPEDYANLKSKSNKQKREIMHDLLELISLLKYSENFNWNASTHEGALQLSLGIESISSITKEIINCEDYFFSSEFLVNALNNRRVGRYKKILKQYIDEVNGMLPLARNT